MRRLDHSGYAVLPRRLGEEALAAARDEIGALLAVADWDSGFDGSRTRRVWALLAKTRCMDQAAPVEMPAGSVLLFAGRLWHGAGASTRPRLAVVIDYVQPWLRPCEGHTLSAGPDQVRPLPQRLQELLGFNQPSPYLGFIDGQHPHEWLMRT